MTKKQLAEFMAKIAPEKMVALRTLETLMRQTGQHDKLAAVQEEISERRAQVS